MSYWPQPQHCWLWRCLEVSDNVEDQQNNNNKRLGVSEDLRSIGEIETLRAYGQGQLSLAQSAGAGERRRKSKRFTSLFEKAIVDQTNTGTVSKGNLGETFKALMGLSERVLMKYMN